MDRVPINVDEDVTIAVVMVQSFAKDNGFTGESIQRVGTAVSELTRNICKYCKFSGGDVVMDIHTNESGQTRLIVQVRDNGPGIADLKLALQDHYSSSGTLGLGLPGVRRIVDSFDIMTKSGHGTVVTIGMDLR